MKLRVVFAAVAGFAVFVAKGLIWIGRKMSKWLLVAWIVLTIVILAFLAVRYVHGWWSLRQEWGAWEEAGMPLRSLGTRYPAAPISSSARKLDELVRPLGIVLIWSEPLWDVTEQPLLLAMNKWVYSLEEKRHDRVEPLPPDVEAFVSEHRGAVSRIVAHLLTSETIVWERNYDVIPPSAAPIPWGPSHWTLQSVLLAYAMSNALHGRQDIAAEALDAVWRHYDSIGSRPDYDSQFLAAKLATRQNAALRQLRYVNSKWDERIGSYDLASVLARSLQLEAYGVLSLASVSQSSRDWVGESEESPSFIVDLVDRIGVTGVVGVGSAEASRRLRWASERIRGGAICELDPEALAEEAESLGFLTWMFLDSIYSYSRLGTFLPSALDGELTGMVLEARKAEEMAGPPSSGSTRPSRVCTTVVWRYQTQPDGTWSIRAEGEIPPGDRGIEQFAFTISR